MLLKKKEMNINYKIGGGGGGVRSYFKDHQYCTKS